MELYLTKSMNRPKLKCLYTVFLNRNAIFLKCLLMSHEHFLWLSKEKAPGRGNSCQWGNVRNLCVGRRRYPVTYSQISAPRHTHTHTQPFYTGARTTHKWHVPWLHHNTPFSILCAKVWFKSYQSTEQGTCLQRNAHLYINTGRKTRLQETLNKDRSFDRSADVLWQYCHQQASCGHGATSWTV